MKLYVHLFFLFAVVPAFADDVISPTNAPESKISTLQMERITDDPSVDNRVDLSVKETEHGYVYSARRSDDLSRSPDEWDVLGRLEGHGGPAFWSDRFANADGRYYYEIDVDHIQAPELNVPDAVPDPNGETLRSNYVSTVQNQVPGTELSCDWTRTLICNGDFGADILEWETVNSPQISFESGTYSHQALRLSGYSDSGLRQRFIDRLEDFLFVSTGKVSEATGLLFRLQAFIKSDTATTATIGIVLEDESGTHQVEHTLSVDPIYKVYSKYFSVPYAGTITNAYLYIHAPSASADLQLERVELRAVAPIAADISLGEGYPRWMVFRNGTDIRVADMLANARAKITHALRSLVVTTLKNFEPTRNVLHIDHDNFMRDGVDYRQSAWNVGSTVVGGTTPTETNLNVIIPGTFGKAKYFWGNIGKEMVLYSLDGEGKPDFSTTELVEIISATASVMNNYVGSVTVVRNADGAGAHAFSDGNAYIAPVLDGYYDPADPLANDEGLTALDSIVSMYTNDLAATPWKGVEFDTASWYYISDADTDYDFVRDEGNFGGTNIAALGTVEVMRELRETFGEDFIIQCDGHAPDVKDGYSHVGFKSFEWINGVEEESYKAGDSSTSFEFFRHLQELVRYNPVFNYALFKDPTWRYNPQEIREMGASDEYVLGTVAASCILGMVQSFHPKFNDLNDCPGDWGSIHYWDEYYGGELANESWLGKPVGPMMQWTGNMDPAKNLLEGLGWEQQIGNGYSADDISVSFTEQGPGIGFDITISEVPDGVHPPTAVYIASTNLIDSDLMSDGQVYTWTFKARADDWVEYNGTTYEDIPMNLYLALGSNYIEEATTLISDDWRYYSISFIARADRISFVEYPYITPPIRWMNDDTLFLNLESLEDEWEQNKLEPQYFQPTLLFGTQLGSVQIRDLKLHKGDDACWYREFENGLVLHNAGALPWTTVIPDGYRRLLTANDQPYNNGEDLSGKTVTLADGQGLFLVKTAVYDQIESTVYDPPLEPSATVE